MARCRLTTVLLVCVCSAYAADFLVRGDQLQMVFLDEQGNVVVLTHDPDGAVALQDTERARQTERDRDRLRETEKERRWNKDTHARTHSHTHTHSAVLSPRSIVAWRAAAAADVSVQHRTPARRLAAEAQVL